MVQHISRRESLKHTLGAIAWIALAPDHAIPAPAEGETDIPFTDYPANYNANPPNANPNAAVNRRLDIRTIDGHTTPNDQFFFIQHYNRPAVDANTYRLKLTGLVTKPQEFTLADLKKMKSTELVNGYECSGNSARAFEGLSSCGKFTGIPLSQLLKQVGVDPTAREVVFFGTDRGKEDVVFRQQTFKLEQQFARSITLENAMKPDPLLAWELNGQPLDRDHGFPAAADHAGVVWRGECEVALGDSSAGGAIPRQFPGAMVPDAASGGRHGRRRGSGYAVRGERSDAHADQVGDLAGAEDDRRISDIRVRAA